MFNKMLVIVFIFDFYSGYRPGSQFNLCVRNVPSVSFGTFGTIMSRAMNLSFMTINFSFLGRFFFEINNLNVF